MTREQAFEYFRSVHGDSFKDEELIEETSEGEKRWMDAQTGELAPRNLGETK